MTEYGRVIPKKNKLVSKKPHEPNNDSNDTILTIVVLLEEWSLFDWPGSRWSVITRSADNLNLG